MLLAAPISAGVGFLLGIGYIIRFYRKNPSFHYISAEAEVRANAFMEQLKKLRNQE